MDFKEFEKRFSVFFFFWNIRTIVLLKEELKVINCECETDHRTD